MTPTELGRNHMAAQPITAAPDVIELDTQARTLLETYKTARANAAQWEEVAATTRAQLEAVLGDAQAATIDGQKAISYAWSKPVERLDTKRLKAERPDIAAAFMAPALPTRSFRLVEPE